MSVAETGTHISARYDGAARYGGTCRPINQHSASGHHQQPLSALFPLCIPLVSVLLNCKNKLAGRMGIVGARNEAETQRRDNANILCYDSVSYHV